MAANDPANIRLGPCLVIYDGQQLGLTKGGVEVELSTETKRIEVDQFGKTAVDEVILGRTLKVKVPVAETDVDSMHRVLQFTGSTLTPGTGTPVAGKFVSVTSGVGISLRKNAKSLILHPQDLPLADKSEDFIVPLAATPGAFSFAYKVDDERVFNLEFTGYPDNTTGVIFFYGDKTLPP